MKKDPNRYPKGWNREKVLEVLRHYENQSEEEAIAGAEAGSREQGLGPRTPGVLRMGASSRRVGKRGWSRRRQ
ncbi:MAG TPA: hypothetical protein VFC78_21915 [Tepidisphaeraceae bacterium]|nr:hypothetical protein [Tepidisphaeraceae bacterium]